MTPEFEQSIIGSKRIQKNAIDDNYAYALYSTISLFKIQKQSLNPFKKKQVTDYSRRIAAAIISNIREEDFATWYHKVPDASTVGLVKDDLKKEGWLVVNPDK